MAGWLHRTTKAHIARLSPAGMATRFGGSFVDAQGIGRSTGDWIFAPDLAALGGLPTRYANIAGAPSEVVTLMTQAERDAVDAVEAAAVVAADKATDSDLVDVEYLTRGLLIAIKDEINILRGKHGLSPRTNAQLRNVVKTEIGNL